MPSQVIDTQPMVPGPILQTMRYYCRVKNHCVEIVNRPYKGSRTCSMDDHIPIRRNYRQSRWARGNLIRAKGEMEWISMSRMFLEMVEGLLIWKPGIHQVERAFTHENTTSIERQFRSKCRDAHFLISIFISLQSILEFLQHSESFPANQK